MCYFDITQVTYNKGQGDAGIVSEGCQEPEEELRAKLREPNVWHCEHHVDQQCHEHHHAPPGTEGGTE